MIKPGWKKFAPFGEYLAILATLAAGIIYIIQGDFTLYVQICLGVIVIGLAIYALLNPQGVRETLTGRQVRYGSNVLVLAIAVFGIAIVINFLGFKNSKRWDMTENQDFTLSTETINVLDKLKEPVMAQAFFTARFPSDSASKLLESYKFSGKGKFDFQFINPEADPMSAKAANITRDGTIVLKMGNRQEQVSFSDEGDITTALIRLLNPGQRTVYFLIGNGEFDTEATGDHSYSQVSSLLKSKNYSVQSLNLLSNPAIPKDALAVIIAGNRKPLNEQEVNALSTYVDQGGSMIVLSDPPAFTYGDQKDLLTDYLANIWGIKLHNNVIIDPNVNPPLFAVSQKYAASHPITDKLMKVVSVFPTSHSITVEKKGSEISEVDLITTSDLAWGETDMEKLKNNQVAPDKTKDDMGPLTLAVAAVNNTKQSRVIVVGDADFASDTYVQSYANGDFILNSIDWASKQETLISLTPKKQVNRILIPPMQYTFGLLILLTIIAIPLLVLFAGIFTWIIRRRRG